MRVENHSVGSILHVVQRGTRGVSIAETAHEKWRFLRALLYLNCSELHHDWDRDTRDAQIFAWPRAWSAPKPLVEVLAWTLMSNHFHLLLREVCDGGIAKFMQRLCGSMTRYFNALHEEKGTLFQGGYKGRLVSDDSDLRYVSCYIMGKNLFELYPGGIQKAANNFEDAWRFGIGYPFSSFSSYATGNPSPIMPREGNLLMDIFETPEIFEKDIQDMVESWVAQNSDPTRQVGLGALGEAGGILLA